MSQIAQLGSGTIWICRDCKIWWGSQVGKRPSTNFLQKLDEVGLLPAWEDYRGWKLSIHQDAICPECGNAVSEPALQSN